MNAILYDKVKISKVDKVQVFSLKKAPKGYAGFDKGAAMKYGIEPHGIIPA